MSLLASLQSELRREVVLLNELCHPVHPAPADKIAAAEARVAEIRAAIAEIREQRAAESAE